MIIGDDSYPFRTTPQVVDHFWSETEPAAMTHADLATEAVIDDVVFGLRGALRDGLVGLYLYGSYVSGGFDSSVSDLDFVAVTRLDAAQLPLPALDRVHRQIVTRHPGWTDRLEIVYVGEEALRDFRSSPSHVAVISPGEAFHLRDEPIAEWVQNWYLIRETDVTLHGPPADAVVPQIEWSEFVAAAVRYATEIAARDVETASRGDLAYAVLTMCRSVATIETDRRPSKQEAAAWARSELPDWAWLIDAALVCRLSRGTVGFDDAASRNAAEAFVSLLASRVRARP